MAEAIDFTRVWGPFTFAKRRRSGYNNPYFFQALLSSLLRVVWASELSAQEASSKQNTEPRQMN
jgi:hypothetical protein